MVVSQILLLILVLFLFLYIRGLKERFREELAKLRRDLEATDSQLHRLEAIERRREFLAEEGIPRAAPTAGFPPVEPSIEEDLPETPGVEVPEFAVRGFAPILGQPVPPERDAPPQPAPQLPPPLHLEETPAVVSPALPPQAPPMPAPTPKQTPKRPPAPAPEPFSLERFMGVKLFAWFGGLAMFFGVIFFVKYAFDNNLIPPSLRVVLGYGTGLGLLVGGLITHRKNGYQVLGQTFCATGVVILYGVTFAAHALYRFPAFNQGTTFVVMSLVTAGAFLLSVRMNALVVAILGMLGGFLTPALLATDQDQVFSLFSYIALLDIGLLAISRHRNWSFLSPCAAFGTVCTLAVWMLKFFDLYDEGSRLLVPMGLQLFFILLFLAGAAFRPQRKADAFDACAVLLLILLAGFFALVMLAFKSISERYFLLHGFTLLVQASYFALVVVRPRWGRALSLAGAFGFLHLGIWTAVWLKPDNLMPVLALYLIFGLLHAVGPLLLKKKTVGGEYVGIGVGSWFGPLVLLLITLALVILPEAPLSLWLAALVADLMVIGLAIVTAAVVPVLISLVITMALSGIWLFKDHPASPSEWPFLIIVAGFSLLFAIAGKKLSERLVDEETRKPDIAARLLPAFSGCLPFLLLVMAVFRLPVGGPSPLFLVALLMACLLLALSLYHRRGALALAALGGIFAVMGCWHLEHYGVNAAPWPPLLWYLALHALFLGFPFVFRRYCTTIGGTWIAAALSGVGSFALIHHLVRLSFPNEVMGLLPAAFAVPSGIALYAVLKKIPAEEGNHESRIAWFGGVTLLFLTLIFPVQWERQWLTIGWALEGAALIWLYRRVAHCGLLFTGLGLLAAAFVRLTFNPAVFISYPRSGAAIFNWQLYTYGTAAAALFFGGGWFTDPAGRLRGLPARGCLFGAGGVLLFLLLNLEIADYFTPPGALRIGFDFGGNFARDMTYSISWGLFSLGLLGIGIWRKSPPARYAATGLLIVTLLKLFLHDLAAVESIFRIGALIGVAIIAFIASFLYQRFFRTQGV